MSHITIKKEYHPNGTVKVERRYKNGRLHGISKFYTEDGKLWATQNSTNGVKESMHFVLQPTPVPAGYWCTEEQEPTKHNKNNKEL